LGDSYIVCKQATEVGEEDSPCSDNTVLFLFSSMQYIVCCLCFSISKPFRKPIYTNPLFLGSVILMVAYQAFLLI